MFGSRLKVLALLAIATAGCTSHSIPIPPPEPEKVYFSLDLDAGEASFRYSSSPSHGGATVYIFNRMVGQGVITTAEADGSVRMTQPFPAMSQDEVVVSFETEGQVSSTCVKMQDGQSSSALECEL